MPRKHPKCPDCHWMLQFRSGNEVYGREDWFDRWMGVCVNRHCPRVLAGDHVVHPSEVADVLPLASG